MLGENVVHTRRYNNEPKRLGDILSNNTDNQSAKMPVIGTVLRLKQLWYRLMGERVCLISSPYRIKNKILFIAVHDPMWIAELPYIKEDMLGKIRAEQIDLDDIKFQLAKIAKRQPVPVTPPRHVTEQEQHWAERLSMRISDEKVRKTYFNALMACLSRNSK